MHDFIVNFIPYLEHLNIWWYLIVFLSAFIESIIIAGYFMPGSTIIIIFWMLAWGWYYDLWDVLFFSVLWNVLWNLTSFYIWKKVWNKALKEGFYFIKAEHFIKADKFFEEHWWKSVLFWKLIPGVKENIPFVAWILEMWVWKFLFYNILGGIVWSIIFVGLWYIFSSSLTLAETWATRFWYIILILFLFFWIIYLIKYLFIKFRDDIFSFLKDFWKFLVLEFRKNKKIKKFIKIHPKIITFLKNRLNKNNFDGLPLTILFVLFLYVFTEFIWMTDAILDQWLITQIDVRLSEFFFYFKDIRLINFFLFISYFWNPIIVFLLTFIVSLILLLKNKKFETIWLLSSVFISSIVSTISKIIIARPRPEYAVYKELSYSFPSFHAVISVALYGFIIWLFLVWIKKWKKRINLIFLWITIAFLIWFSRLYLNVHYLSDVISGWFLGFLGLLLWITITWYLKHKYHKNNFLKYFQEKEENKFKNLLSILLIISFLLFSIFYYKIYYRNIVFTTTKNEVYKNITNINNLFKNNPHLRFTETITGRDSVPINFIFLAKNDNDLINIFKKSWWKEADKLWRRALKNMWKNLLTHKTYETAPMTPLYWNKEIQDFWFQKLPKIDTIKYRHHIRIWKTNYKIGDYYIFVWCWIYDNWIKWWITHKIDPDIDKERDYILKSLEKTNFIDSKKYIMLEKDWFNWTNFSGDPFFTNWKAYILKIK